MKEPGPGIPRRGLLPAISFLVLLSSASSDGQHSNGGYLVLAPVVFRSGVDQTITVRIFEHQDPILVNATIVELREHSTIASQTSTIQGDGKITLRVPKGVEGKATLQICGNCHEHATFRFQDSTTITIVNKGTSTFVQTDKPIYKPNQKVHINVYTVDRDLRPVAENITVYAKSPNDIKIVEWRNLQPACCGTVTVAFPLSDQPPLGEWKVFAVSQRNTYNTTFEVGKYVLPKFDVAITPPQLFRDFSVCEEAVVSAKYSFGKAVKGTLEVNMTVRDFGYFSRHQENGVYTKQKMPFNGESRFSICIQNNLGRHALENFFRGTLEIWATVTSEDGSQFSAFDDTTIVSRNYVELEFTDDTRKYFKHGMPFQGQVFASFLNGEPAENILIEVKVEGDNHDETFVGMELLSPSDGLVSFTIPAFLQAKKFAWLQARVIAIDGKYTNKHQYLAVYRALHSWHSPSGCHLLIEKSEEKLTVNRPIDFLVKSTCGCDFTLYYELLSRGDILLSKSIQVNDSNSDYLVGPDDHVCQTTIQVIPTPNMAPLAKLLAYYVRQNGEGVADSMHLPVEPVFENNVEIDIPHKIVNPRDEIKVTVRADEDSCVCLGLTDKSLHFISPEYLLSKEEIFEEMHSYDMNNLPFEEERPTVLRHMRSRARRSPYERHLSGRDSFHAFLETGLVVMSDVVVLKHNQDVQVFSEIRTQSLTRAPMSKIRRKSRKLRFFFPETWYWNCFNVNSDGERQINLQVPDTVTSWVVNAVGTSPGAGIGVAENVEVNALKSFFVEFNMPYSATRGEEMDLPITVHNYVGVCAQVRLAVSPRSGTEFPASTHGSARRMMVKHICIGPRDTVATKFRLLFGELGDSKILAVADAVEGPNLCCNAAHRLITKDKEVNGTDEILNGNIVGADAVMRKILVQPEGEPRKYTHSVFFCPKERMSISTLPSTFRFVKFPKKKSRFNFLVRARSSVHIAFTVGQAISASSYEVIIGGIENTVSWIAGNEQTLTRSMTTSVLSDQEFRAFWIEWTDNSISVGYGMDPTPASRFLHLQIEEPIDASFIALGTSGQSTAEFHLWPTEEMSQIFSEVFQLDVPSYAIPGSVRGHATVIGDVMGPTLRNLNNLLKLPYGCGEQNMINFAPNIYILKYLKTTNQLTSEIEETARDYLIQGYQRQLTYRRQSGAYSAFGHRDEQGSMWLTAFVMKSYAKAREFIYIDQREIDSAMEWILKHQMEDGSFPPHGKIMNKDVQAGIDRKISLTAYVIVALLESGAEGPEASEAIERAVEYLGKISYEYQDPYTAALAAYALTLGGSMSAHGARDALLGMSLTGSSGGYRYWMLGNFVENDMFPYLSSTTKQTVASARIELASYALLAFTKSGDVSTALGIVRWITQQRNSQGGFSSTQDTCTALQALSSYATFAYMGGVNLNITLEGPNNYAWNVFLDNKNSDILQKGAIPPLGPDSIPVFLKASGDGCALLQIHVEFNIPEPEGKKEFVLQVSMNNPGSLAISNSLLKRKRDSGDPVRPVLVEPRDSIQLKTADKKTSEMRVCGRWKNHGSSNMAVLEVPLLTGYAVDLESLSKALSNKTRSLKRFEVENSNTVVFYFDEISSVCKTCVTFQVRREFDVMNPSSKIVKLYDYYEPGYESSVPYNLMNQNCLTDGGCLDPLILEPDDGFPECKCYRECGYEGPRVCGDDGNWYDNACRMEVNSCESGSVILQQDDALCVEDTITDMDDTNMEPTDMNDTIAEPELPSSELYDYFGENLYEPDMEYFSDINLFPDEH